MKRYNNKLKLTTVELEFISPIDYELVYNEMSSKIAELIVKNDIKNAKKIINISSGTPTMTACWVLIKESGQIPNATLLQALRPEHRKTEKASVEVNLILIVFPK